MTTRTQAQSDRTGSAVSDSQPQQQSADHRIYNCVTGPSDHRTIGSADRDHRIIVIVIVIVIVIIVIVVGSADSQTIGPSDHHGITIGSPVIGRLNRIDHYRNRMNQVIGPSDHRTIGSADHRIFG